MPAPIYYAHKILENLTKYRKAGERNCGKLGPDAKSQVTIRYENGKPAAVTQIVLSTQHVDAKLTSKDVQKIVEPVIRETLEPASRSPRTASGGSTPPASSSSAARTATPA